MSAALLRAVQTASAQVLAAWRAMPGAYLLLGRASGPLPKSGSARLARQAGTAGMFRTFFWSLGADQTVGYLTVIRLPDHVDLGDESEIVLRGARGADRDFALRLAPFCEEEEFGRHLASLAGTSSASIARFILDLMRPEQEVDVRRPVLLLESFLQHAARHEGCVELLLEIPNRILLLQGWGPPTGDDVEIVLTGPSLTRHTAQVGEFSRNDIQAPLTGSVLALPVSVAADLLNAQSIFLLTPDEILCRRILESRVLDPVSSTGQIRHLLPRLLCPPTLAATLQQALQPQYEGVDTLNTAERPVRAALDIAVAAEGIGAFISGWLFDPAGHVAKVEFCAGADAIQINHDIVRIQREDVLLAFKGDPALPRSTKSDFGFAVHVSTSVITRPHLRFTFTDDDVAFTPLDLRSATDAGVRAQLCDSVDMHKQSGIDIVQRHLAPFLSKAPPPELGLSSIILRGPLDRPHAIVVPLASSILPRAVIAGLLGEPLAEDEQIIFVCGSDWRESTIQTLVERLQFYGIPATFIAMPDRIGPMDAVLAASAHAQAATFMILSPTASNPSAGSRAMLRAAAEDSDVVCPTVLYEDGSVRFAGTSELDFVDRAPFARRNARWLGLSAAHITTRDPVDAAGGTLECCLLRRTALASVERARRFTTKFGQEAALFCELQSRGSRIVWQPAMVIATAEEREAASINTAATLVDNWALRASWGQDTCAF